MGDATKSDPLPKLLGDDKEKYVALAEGELAKTWRSLLVKTNASMVHISYVLDEHVRRVDHGDEDDKNIKGNRRKAMEARRLTWLTFIRSLVILNTPSIIVTIYLKGKRTDGTEYEIETVIDLVTPIKRGLEEVLSVKEMQQNVNSLMVSWKLFKKEIILETDDFDLMLKRYVKGSGLKEGANSILAKLGPTNSFLEWEPFIVGIGTLGAEEMCLHVDLRTSASTTAISTRSIFNPS